MSKGSYTQVDAEVITDAVVMVEVEAPATLQAGYKFNATYEGVVFPVIVPEGGVVQGQKLTVPFDKDAVITTETITGAWKDGLCDCFAYGCHPSCYNACLCDLVLLGQVMTRLKLDWLARPASDPDVKKTFSTMVKIYVAYVVLLIIFSGPGDDDDDDYDDTFVKGDGDVESPSPMYQFINLIYAIFLLVILTQVRKIVREKYGIPEQRCIGCEDCCCAWWCTCCTISQLARQTADYDTEVASYCTNDGLSKSSLSPALIV